MHSKKTHIPPLQALRALDALARCGSVWEAAEYLGISRSAVSHRLALLEATLGFEVAVRSGKGVTLTPRGRRYALNVQKSLELLADAQEEGGAPLEGDLCISSTPGFAAMWLCNHVGAFQADHPDLNLRIVVNRELDQATERGVDLYIVFGEGGWPKQHVQHLYDVEFLPMCSPALLNSNGGLNEPGDVSRFTLLHLNEFDDWRRWLTLAGVSPPRREGIRFSDLMLVQTAAISGQGIMMGDAITCAAALSAGQLVAPFPIKIKSPAGYYLVRPGQKRPSTAVVAFTRWLNALMTRATAELSVGLSSPLERGRQDPNSRRA